MFGSCFLDYKLYNWHWPDQAVIASFQLSIMPTALSMNNGLICSIITGIHFCLYTKGHVMCHMDDCWMIVYADDNSKVMLCVASWNDAFM